MQSCALGYSKVVKLNSVFISTCRVVRQQWWLLRDDSVWCERRQHLRRRQRGVIGSIRRYDSRRRRRRRIRGHNCCRCVINKCSCTTTGICTTLLYFGFGTEYILADQQRGIKKIGHFLNSRGYSVTVLDRFMHANVSPIYCQCINHILPIYCQYKIHAVIFRQQMRIM